MKKKLRPSLNNHQREKLRIVAELARRRMSDMGLIVREANPIREAERMLVNDHDIMARDSLIARYEHLMQKLGGEKWLG